MDWDTKESINHPNLTDRLASQAGSVTGFIQGRTKPQGLFGPQLYKSGARERFNDLQNIRCLAEKLDF